MISYTISSPIPICLCTFATEPNTYRNWTRYISSLDVSCYNSYVLGIDPIGFLFRLITKLCVAHES